MSEQAVIWRAGRENIQTVRSVVSGGLELRQRRAREILVQKEFHPVTSRFDGFHGGQAAGKLKTRANVQLFECGVILQDFLNRLSGRDSADNVCDGHARTAYDGFPVAHGRVETDSV